MELHPALSLMTREEEGRANMTRKRLHLGLNTNGYIKGRLVYSWCLSNSKSACIYITAAQTPSFLDNPQDVSSQATKHSPCVFPRGTNRCHTEDLISVSAKYLPEVPVKSSKDLGQNLVLLNLDQHFFILANSKNKTNGINFVYTLYLAHQQKEADKAEKVCLQKALNIWPQFQRETFSLRNVNWGAEAWKGKCVTPPIKKGWERWQPGEIQSNIYIS